MMKLRSSILWGAHAPSRAGFGALAETIFNAGAIKVRDGEGAIPSTRWRVRSPNFSLRRRIANPALTLIAIFVFALGIGAQTPKPGQSYQAAIDDATARGVPGLQAFVRKGEARWSGASGVSSVEKSIPMNLTPRIRLASITKMMTHAVVMDLVKQGRLRLSDLAVTLLPPGALDGIPFSSDITVAQLLEHTSGLHNFNGEDSRDFYADLFSDPQRGTRRWTSGELLAYAKKPQHRPTGRPGARMSYSSTGYIVLEMILENVGGKPFPQLFREHLFDPLGLSSAGVEGADFGASEISDSYARPSSGDLRNASPFAGRKPARPDGLMNLSAGLKHYNAWAGAAGAVAANVEDLAKFMDAVAAGRFAVLRDQAAEFARSKLKPDSYFDWNGGSWGIQATILFEPFRDLTVIVLSNASNTGPSSHDVAKHLLAAAREAPQP